MLYYGALVLILPDTLENRFPESREKSLPNIVIGFRCCTLVDTRGRIHYSLLCTNCVHNDYQPRNFSSQMRGMHRGDEVIPRDKLSTCGSLPCSPQNAWPLSNHRNLQKGRVKWPQGLHYCHPWGGKSPPLLKLKTVTCIYIEKPKHRLRNQKIRQVFFS